MIGDYLLLFVAHTVYDDDETEVIRIISARKADPKEMKGKFLSKTVEYTLNLANRPPLTD